MLKFAIILMMALVAASNYLVMFPINQWLTWGAFIYPLTFFVTELVNRFYGPAKARTVVWFGFFLAVILSVLFVSWRIGLASCTAFLVSQLLDISIFFRLRKLSWWKAPFFASFLATLIDTGIFFILAFAGQDFPWITIAFGDFLVKFSIDILCLLPFRMIIGLNQLKTN